jgi:hypothetical protein
MEWSKLVRVFSLCNKPYQKIYVAAPPSEASIAHINKSFGIELPAAFIQFAHECPTYGTWFSSIGEDYDNYLHIFQINKVFREPDPERKGELPPWLVIINHGHDYDCDCLDTRAFNAETREYPIQYWHPRLRETRDPHTTFQEYLSWHVEKWAKGVPPIIRKEIDEVLLP